MRGMLQDDLLYGAGTVHGGLRKRIDENRELLETLMRHAPDLLRDRPWVVGWIKATDEFLTSLDRAAGHPFADMPGAVRPWPTPEGDQS